MAKHWGATTFAALVLLCSLLGNNVEAQDTSAWYKGKQPKYPNPPKMMPVTYVLPPGQPDPPGYPKIPPAPVPPTYPQKPQLPQEPQHPQKPQRPQKPPLVPQYPQKPPQVPQYPQPQKPSPQMPSPQMPSPQMPPLYPQQPAQQETGVHYDQTSKHPPQRPQTPQIPSPPPVKSCDVERQVRVPCGVRGISAAACESIDCCFDGQSCYFGKGVTVQCTKDAHFIVVVAREVTTPNIDLETISLLGAGQSCTHVDSNSAFAIYYFGVTDCGSVVMEEPGVIMYENRMTSSYEVGIGPHGAITRDSSYELLFQCRYLGTSVETLVVEVLPLDNPPLPIAEMGPLRVHLRIANGQCETKGCNEVDVAYTSYYMDSDYPVTKVLRDPVYVEVQLLDRTDPALVLTLGRCWATTSPEPHSLPQWDIMIDGCPYRDDRYLSRPVPVAPIPGFFFPNHYKRFFFKMFTFVDPNSMEPLREHVYIHCSTTVCVPGLGASCEPQCFRRRRDVDQKELASEPKVVVSSKEIIMTSAAAAAAE